VFRPHAKRFNEGSSHPKSDSFFQLRALGDPTKLRGDAHRWETTLNASKCKRGTSLKDPVFDIHFNARQGSRDAGDSTPIRYALVISIEAPRAKYLYDEIVARYRTQIQPLQPTIQIPVRL